MNLNFVLGTAAELIKMYPVIVEALREGHGVRVLSTGQSGDNFEMQYRDLNLPLEHLAHLMDEAQDLAQARRALSWFLRALRISPTHFRAQLQLGSTDFVLVHGDTLSSLVGAWHGWRAGIKVAHVEAGLRSPRMLNPFPEEITRRLVSRFARLHFVPDEVAEANLRRAKVKGQIICTEGNTLLDAVQLSAALAPAPARHKRFALANLHRFENLNSTARWSKMLEVVEQTAQKIPLIFVAHPQTQQKLSTQPEVLERFRKLGVEVLGRMPFSQFIALLKQSEFLISDGGSNQEECSYLGKPCLLLREATERREGLEGCCVLSRFDDHIIQTFLDDPQAFRRPALASRESPSKRILNALQKSGT